MLTFLLPTQVIAFHKPLWDVELVVLVIEQKNITLDTKSDISLSAQ